MGNVLEFRNLFLEDDTHSGRPKTSVTYTKADIALGKVEQGARLSVKEMASCTDISNCFKLINRFTCLSHGKGPISCVN